MAAEERGDVRELRRLGGQPDTLLDEAAEAAEGQRGGGAFVRGDERLVEGEQPLGGGGGGVAGAGEEEADGAEAVARLVGDGVPFQEERLEEGERLLSWSWSWYVGVRVGGKRLSGQSIL